MYKKSTLNSYSSLSKIFHWFIAVIVILMLSFSFFLSDVPEQYANLAYMLHKSFGLTVLGLMLLRIVWLLYAGRPPLPITVPGWQRFLARTVQYSLYVFLILMPLSGWIMSVASSYIPSYFGLFNVPIPGITADARLDKLMSQTHTVIAWIIIVLLVLHITGAIKHHFIDKDNVLRNMLPQKKIRHTIDNSI